MIIPPLVQVGLEKLSERIQSFDHTQVRNHPLLARSAQRYIPFCRVSQQKFLKSFLSF